MQKRNEIDMEEKREVQNNNIIEVFPDIIETTFDISDDVTGIGALFLCPKPWANTRDWRCFI